MPFIEHASQHQTHEDYAISLLIILVTTRHFHLGLGRYRHWASPYDISKVNAGPHTGTARGRHFVEETALPAN